MQRSLIASNVSTDIYNRWTDHRLTGSQRCPPPPNALPEVCRSAHRRKAQTALVITAICEIIISLGTASEL
jgi:hypothetical protein